MDMAYGLGPEPCHTFGSTTFYYVDFKPFRAPKKLNLDIFEKNMQQFPPWCHSEICNFDSQIPKKTKMAREPCKRINFQKKPICPIIFHYFIMEVHIMASPRHPARDFAGWYNPQETG
jgi:hypothetical protein